MTRAPKETELLVLRRLMDRAGGKKALAEWMDRAATERRRGRPVGSDKYQELDIILRSKVQSALDFQNFDDVDLPVPMASITAAVRTVVEHGFVPVEWGTSKEAVISRLLNRIKQEPGELAFHRRERGSGSQSD